MTGIIDYAHTETRSFADLPFNEIDALIISTLIYEDVASVWMRRGQARSPHAFALSNPSIH